jgi:hypothetical protein
VKTLILFCLLTGFAYGAQSTVIKEGSTTYGPIAMSQLHRVSQISFTRTSNAFTSLTILFEYSPDKGANWIWYGTTVFPGGGPLTAPLGSLKQLPNGVIATHIRVTALAVGGSITLQKDPVVATK